MGHEDANGASDWLHLPAPLQDNCEQLSYHIVTFKRSPELR